MAKPIAEGQPSLAGLSAIPTQEKPLTEKGVVVGTVQYMAPEQLEGKEADARTDLFAFGALLYEMVTGKKAFEGKSQLSGMTAILEHDPPPISTVQRMTPPALEHVVKTCLAKDPHDRWQAAGDVARNLMWIAEVGGKTETPVSATTPPTILRWGLALVLASALSGLAVWNVTRPEPPRLTRMVIATPDPLYYFGRSSDVAISPDGRRIVYTASTQAGPQLYVRAVDQFEATPLQGLGEMLHGPFMSPDGNWVGYFAGPQPAPN